MQMEALAGFKPAAIRLTAGCSITELQGHMERQTRFELVLSGWRPGVLPLNTISAKLWWNHGESNPAHGACKAPSPALVHVTPLKGCFHIPDSADGKPRKGIGVAHTCGSMYRPCASLWWRVPESNWRLGLMRPPKFHLL